MQNLTNDWQIECISGVITQSTCDALDFFCYERDPKILVVSMKYIITSCTIRESLSRRPLCTLAIHVELILDSDKELYCVGLWKTCTGPKPSHLIHWLDSWEFHISHSLLAYTCSTSMFWGCLGVFRGGMIAIILTMVNRYTVLQ